MHEGRARIPADAAVLQLHADLADLVHAETLHLRVHRLAQHVLGVLGHRAREHELVHLAQADAHRAAVSGVHRGHVAQAAARRPRRVQHH